MKKIYILLFIVVISGNIIHLTAQVGINTDGSDPNASAMLDVKSTDKGFLPPRMTTSQRDSISSPAEGLTIYNLNTKRLEYFNGSKWRGFTFQSSSDVSCGNDFIDSRDGKVYGTVQIGNQCWMKENLNIGIRVDGIETMTDNDTIEKYCYDDTESNCDTYGSLYQWDEMMQYVTTEGDQGICPNGWHIPTDEEWKQLEGEADSQFDYPDPEWDGSGYRGFDAGLNLKSTNDWYNSGNGIDFYSFRILPAGWRDTGGNFVGQNEFVHFWVSKENNSGSAWNHGLFYHHDNIYRTYASQSYGFSVRCVKD